VGTKEGEPPILRACNLVRYPGEKGITGENISEGNKGEELVPGFAYLEGAQEGTRFRSQKRGGSWQKKLYIRGLPYHPSNMNKSKGKNFFDGRPQ